MRSNRDQLVSPVDRKYAKSGNPSPEIPRRRPSSLAKSPLPEGRKVWMFRLPALIVVLVILVLAMAASAQATDVSVTGLSVTCFSPPAFDAWPRVGWKYSTHVDSLRVLAYKPVAKIVRAYVDIQGVWQLGSGTVSPQNGKSGAIEASFGSTNDQQNHLGEWYTWVYTGGATAINGTMWTDDTPFGSPGWLTPNPGTGWSTWMAGKWMVIYTDGTYEEVWDSGRSASLGFRSSCNYTNDPVNTSTGNAAYAFTDIFLPGKGLGLVFARSYNSQDASADGPLGYGWNHSYSTRLLVLSDYAVALVYPDGHRAAFEKQSDGSYKQPPETKEKLVKNANGTFTVTSANQVTYEFSSSGRLESLSDRYDNETALTYDGNGRLTGVTDAGGRSLTLSYTGDRISSVIDNASRSVGYGYDGSGNLTTVSDLNNHATTYSYDSLHQLTSIEQPEASANPFVTNTYVGGRVTEQTDALGATTELEYDSAGAGTTVTGNGHSSIDTWDRSSFRLGSQSDPYSHVFTFTYDWRGRLSSTTDENGHTTGFGYDANDNPSSIVDADGHAVRMGYDQKNNLLYQQNPLGERLSRTTSGLLLRDDFASDTLSSYTTATQSGTPSWSINSGVLSQTTASAVGSLTRNEITTAKCATALVALKASSPSASLLVGTGQREGSGLGFPGYQAQLSTSGTQYLKKRVSGTETSLANVSRTLAVGQPSFVRLYIDGGTVYMKAGTSDLSRLAISKVDSAFTAGSGGFKATSVCDFGYLEVRTSQKVTVTGLPSGYKARAISGAQNALATASSGTAVIDCGALLFPLDKVEVLDTSNNPVAELTAADLADIGGGDVFAYDDSVGHRTTYSWDANGLFLDSVASPIGTTDFTWNTDGTLDSLTDARSHAWSYGYNTAGDLTSVEDPLTHVITYEYDAVGRVTAQEDANGSRVETTYDGKGNPVTVKDPLAEGDQQNRHQVDISYDLNDNVTEIEDARGNTTSFSYDDMNHLTLLEDALSGEVAFGYDEVYNRTSREDPNGHTTQFAYDDLNRLHTVTDPLSKVTTYDYDNVGNLTSLGFPSDDETSFSYTSDNLIHEISHSGDPAAYTYSYNTLRAVSQVEDNNGDTWAYTYDEGNRLTSESDENNAALGTFTVERTFDAVSNVTGLNLNDLVSLALTHDAREQLATLTDPGGTTEFTYDAGGRMTEIATPDGSTRSFTFDAGSRPTEVENVTDSGTQTFTYTYDANGNVTGEGSATYTYDALNRLTSWYDPVTDVTTSYAYDAGGNLTEVEEDSVPTETYTHNAGDEITNTGYTYDDNGNLTADGSFTYTYDGDNQVVEVDEGETTIATMTYDFTGRRSSLTTSAGTTYFHYAGSFLVAESDENGDVTATYAYTPGGGPISMTRGANTYYYQTNAHGDVVSLTDSTGAVVNTYRYDPWGKPLSETGTVVNPLRYAGYYYDDATGLYYLWHRYYDADTKRFLTVDPAVVVTFSPYGYAADNPLFSTDPVGLSALDWFNEHLNPVYGLMVAGGDMAAGYRANGARGVLDAFNMDLNPAYKMYVAYANELDAYNRGCSLWKVAGYGAEGVFHAAMLGLTAAGIEAARERVLSNLSAVDLASEAGYLGPKPQIPRYLTKNIDLVYKNLEAHHGIDKALAKQRLHDIKYGSGNGFRPDTDMYFDMTGGVYGPYGEYIDTMTAGGARRR
jgi:RHS repeat-associated protein